MSRLRFQFRHGGASKVVLAGDFNGWSSTSHPMEQQGHERWVLELELTPGRHEYKFLVDGRQWWNDPEGPKIPNPWGSGNSSLGPF